MGANLKKLRLVVLLRGFTELTCTTAVLIEDSIAVNATWYMRDLFRETETLKSWYQPKEGWVCSCLNYRSSSKDTKWRPETLQHRPSILMKDRSTTHLIWKPRFRSGSKNVYYFLLLHISITILFIYLSIRLFIYLFIYLFNYLFIYYRIF